MAGVWKKSGSPDWTNKTVIEWYFEFSKYSLGFYLDGVNFGEGAFRATENNTYSQAEAWGIVEAAPEVDTSLNSDAECTLRALALLEESAYA